MVTPQDKRTSDVTVFARRVFADDWVPAAWLSRCHNLIMFPRSVTPGHWMAACPGLSLGWCICGGRPSVEQHPGSRILSTLPGEGGWMWWNPSSDAGLPWATVQGALPPGPPCAHLGDGKVRTHPARG